MIFVTVGTHEQQFNRLIKAVDDLIDSGAIKEDVIIQKGYSDYNPKNCKAYTLISHKDMQKFVKDARIVITHGGPASFLSVISTGKTPIVMPRRKKYDEHINDHQYNFCKEIKERFKCVIVANDIKELEKAINGYDSKKGSKVNNSINFNNKLINYLEVEYER